MHKNVTKKSEKCDFSLKRR